MSCPQCFSGHVNPGEPKGTITEVYGRRTYIAEPPEGKEPKGVVVIILDAFGLPFVNNQILADHYASMGQYLVYLPDFMDGTEASVQCMLNMAHVFDKSTPWLSWAYCIGAAVLEFVPFMIRNRFSVSWPKVTSFLTALREDKGASLPVGIAGFCWGGLHAITLTHDRPDTKTPKGVPLGDAFFAAHPSNLTVPSDFEGVTRPLSVAIGDDDAVMPLKQVQQAIDALAKKTEVDTKITVFPGAKHGFAVRASKAVPDSKETLQAEEAEQQAITFFQRQFAGLEK